MQKHQASRDQTNDGDALLLFPLPLCLPTHTLLCSLSGQAKVGELVRSKQLDARFEPVLMNKSKEHLMILDTELDLWLQPWLQQKRPDRTPTQTQHSPACCAPAKCEMRAFVAVGNRDAHILMVWTVYQVCFTHVSMLRGRGFLSGRGCIVWCAAAADLRCGNWYWQCNGDDQRLVEALVSKCDHK